MAFMTPDDRRSPLDDTIDRVAATMTDARPTRDLRARVLARLDEPRAARINWTVLSAAAAVALVAAVFAPRLSRHVVPQPVAAVESSQAANASAPAESGAVEGLEGATVPPQTVRTAASLDEPENGGVEMLPLLEAPAPISHEMIQPEKLSVPQLTVAAIVVPAVDDGSMR
jgi:hypothetical protein